MLPASPALADLSGCAATQYRPAGGIPTSCTTACSRVWASFASRCQVEIMDAPDSNIDASGARTSTSTTAGDMEAFSGVCHLGIGNSECTSNRSCEELQVLFPGSFAATHTWPHQMGGADNICAESDRDGDGDANRGANGCQRLPFVEARNICFELGTRMCRLEELFAGETSGSGCEFDTEQVWSSSPCSATRKHDAWQSSVGDCRYDSNIAADDNYSLLDTLTTAADVQACKEYAIPPQLSNTQQQFTSISSDSSERLLAPCDDSACDEVSFQWKNPDFLSRNPD